MTTALDRLEVLAKGFWEAGRDHIRKQMDAKQWAGDMPPPWEGASCDERAATLEAATKCLSVLNIYDAAVAAASEPVLDAEVAGPINALRFTAVVHRQMGRSILAEESDEAADLIERLATENARQSAAIAKARDALEYIAEEHDAGRHDGLPEPCPANDVYLMWLCAKEALAILDAPARADDLPPAATDGGL